MKSRSKKKQEYPGSAELETLIKRSRRPLLDKFLRNNSKLIGTSHRYTSAIHVKELWTQRFLRKLTQLKPHLLKQSLELCDFAMWDGIFDPKDNYKVIPIRHELFQWGYLALSKRFIELNMILPNIKRNLSQELAGNLTSLDMKLNKACFDYLSKFHRLNYQEKEVLKLSLSHVINLVSESYCSVYESLLGSNIITTLKSISIQKYLRKEKEDIIRITFEKFKEKLDIWKEKGDERVLNNWEVDKVAVQVWGILFTVFSNMAGWMKSRKNSEATICGKIESMLNILFNDCSLRVEPGETACAASKTIRLSNQKFYQQVSSTTTTLPSVAPLTPSSTTIKASSTNSSTNLMGRRSDLLIMDGENELALCEFKPKVQKEKLLKQESKSIRINRSIDIACGRKGAESGSMAMNWNGNEGAMYRLIPYEDIAVATAEVPLKCPRNYDDIMSEEYLKTLIEFYEWKTFLILYKDQIQETAPEPQKITPQVLISPRIGPIR